MLEFGRTVALSAADAKFADRRLGEVSAQVFAVCLDRFPDAKRYRHRIEKDRGVVQGHRFHVERQGFHGVVAVQWYARRHSYRDMRDGGLQVRIGGKARLHPVWSAPPLPELDAQVHGRVLGLGLALLLGTGGISTVRLVLDRPGSFLIDAIGVAMALLAVCGAVYLLVAAFNGKWWHRRPRTLSDPKPDDYAGDLSRWRALCLDVDQLPVR